MLQIIIVGNRGEGKTWLACAIYSLLFKFSKYEVTLKETDATSEQVKRLDDFLNKTGEHSIKLWNHRNVRMTVVNTDF